MQNDQTLTQLALMPVTGTIAQGPEDVAGQIRQIGAGVFCDFLIKKELACLWYDYLEKTPAILSAFTNENRETLKNEKIRNTAMFLNQHKVLEQVHTLFESRNIPYVVFKGACLRHTVYEDPAQRVCSDIDILVPEPSKFEAVQCLVAAGFQAAINPDNISHEISLTSHAATIDLHWKLLRPGRTRFDLAGLLLEHKKRVEHFYGIDDAHNLVVMLVHPAITKYINSPASLLVHMVDLHLLLESAQINDNDLVNILDSAGVKTAAWATLYRYRQLTQNNRVDGLINRLQPGWLKRIYLRYWIDHNLVTHFWQRQLLLKILFSILLQDNAGDMLTAIRQLRKEKQAAESKAREFKNIL